MEAALAQLGATFLRHAIENPQFRNDTNLSLNTLLENLSPERIKSTSVEISDDVIDHQANASRTSEAPATSNMIHASKTDTGAYVSRTLVTRSFKFEESDLFRKDEVTSLRDQYLRWRHNCTEYDDLNPVLDRIVAAAKRLNMLKDDEIGSIPLEMAYYYLFSLYRQYKLGNNVVSLPKRGLCEAILHRLHAKEWENLSDRARQRHRDKLQRELLIGRRWSVAVDHLSLGVIFLAGKRLSSLVHQNNFKLTSLNNLVINITEQHAQACELYNKAAFIGRKLSTVNPLSLSEALSEFNEIETLLCQGQKLKHC